MIFCSQCTLLKRMKYECFLLQAVIYAIMLEEGLSRNDAEAEFEKEKVMTSEEIEFSRRQIIAAAATIAPADRARYRARLDRFRKRLLSE